MRSPDANELIKVVEDAEGATPAQRSVRMLASAFPEASLAELIDASVGQRDFWLLELREAIMGKLAAGRSACPRCAAKVEFEFDIGAFRFQAPDAATTGRIEVEGYAIEYKALTTRDLLRLGKPTDLEGARTALIEAAVVRATFLGNPAAATSLPDSVVEALGDAVWELDPQSEIPLDLECPDCGREWTLPFDAVSFLYGEVAALVARTVEEVRTLARAYGWSEADILAMSPARRRLYREANEK